MIVQRGLVVAEMGRPEGENALASVRKSLLSALIGIAVAHHQINFDATLGSLDIDDNAPLLSAEEKAATVRDLLEARSGVYHPACYETTRMAELFRQRFRREARQGTYVMHFAASGEEALAKLDDGIRPELIVTI